VSALTLAELQEAIAMQNQATQSPKIEKTVLGTNEVCDITGYKKATIYAFTHKRLIPFYKKGKRLLFDRLEIDAWLRQNRIAPISEIVDKAMNL